MQHIEVPHLDFMQYQHGGILHTLQLAPIYAVYIYASLTNMYVVPYGVEYELLIYLLIFN